MKHDTIALEYLDEEGRLVVLHVSRDGGMKRMYPSYSTNFTEPDNYSVHVSLPIRIDEVRGDVHHVYQKIASFIGSDDGDDRDVFEDNHMIGNRASVPNKLYSYETVESIVADPKRFFQNAEKMIDANFIEE